MVKRMLIDATHPEEARVVVLDGDRLDEFDYESKDKHQLKGNIYLAKVTRVEPSLQAAFVEYGGNRHGFLPFSEIHPDYYRLPIADREALMAEEAKAAEEHADNGGNGQGSNEPDEANEMAAAGAAKRNSAEAEAEAESQPEVEELETETSVETLGGDEIDEAAQRRANFLRRYKIQEVIKRRQVMLVQVVKEERGNKGAALTTYLSLAGRYCVLMPNTAKGGGISRKIASTADRRRLKGILADLNIPEGMAIIVRTAGSQRSKAEIRRDYEYLLRLWDTIRSTTLQSTAPSLIYEEATLIKRAVRDLYTREMDEVLVEGEDGYRATKSFMRSLMPSHAKKVQPYRDERIPLFTRYKVEQQLDNIYNPTVQLKSGGYIVINQTEALVAIDVNSGRATRERHIEETALKTNLEAADEVARQLKLRDLAGLVVVDFIDMDAPRHNREVEQRLKDAMRFDRARIQLGRISPFGLLELSRQRLRPSLQEISTVVCPHCAGRGFVRSPNSAALSILRALQEEAIQRGAGEVKVVLPTEIALYLLNEKRGRLIETEERYSLRVRIENDDRLIPPAYRLERLSTLQHEREETSDLADDRQEEPVEEDSRAEAANTSEESEDESGRTRRSRRRSRKRRGGEAQEEQSQESLHETQDAGAEALEAGPNLQESEDWHEDGEAEGEDQSQDDDTLAGEPNGDSENGNGDKPRRRRRRGKRGGRRRSRQREQLSENESEGEAPEATTEDAAPEAESEGIAEDRTPPTAETPATAAALTSVTAAATEPLAPETGKTEGEKTAESGEEAAAEASPKPRRSRRKTAAKQEATAAATGDSAQTEGEAESEAGNKPAARRRRTTRSRTEKPEATAEAEPAPTAEAGVGAGAEGEANAEAEAKPRRRRAASGKATAGETATTFEAGEETSESLAEIPAAPPATAAAQGAVEEAESQQPRSDEIPASDETFATPQERPDVPRVTVTTSRPDQREDEGEANDEEQETRPRRRGWWQRLMN